jgi:hypothetical protein
MESTLLTYRLLARDMTRSLSTKAAEKPVALESGYYLKHIGKVTSIDGFLKDTRLFTYAMKAFGLEDMAYAKGYMRKVLKEGVTDPKSFANKLNDDRFKAFAKVFDFKGLGAAATQSAEAGQKVVDRYVRQALEADQGASNEGVQLALYFQRQAPAVKSVYGLLADPALWKVVKTIYDFPDAMAAAPIEKQAKAVKAQLNIADLKEPAKLDALLRRFSAKWDVAQGVDAAPVLDLFSVRTSSAASFSILNLKYGG